MHTNHSSKKILNLMHIAVSNTRPSDRDEKIVRQGEILFQDLSTVNIIHRIVFGSTL